MKKKISRSLIFIFVLVMISSFMISAAPVKMDFAEMMGSGKWVFYSGEAIPIKDNAFQIPMAERGGSTLAVYDVGDMTDFDIEFEIRYKLDDKMYADNGTSKNWTDADAWCSIIAFRDTFIDTPYWNAAETGSYTIMYHPKQDNLSRIMHWASSNRASKKGELQVSEVPDLTGDAWHKMRVVMENTGTDKVKFDLYFDGKNVSSYQANRTSDKGYLTFYNVSTSMEIRAVGGAAPKYPATTNPTTVATSPGETNAPTDSTLPQNSGFTSENIKSTNDGVKINFESKTININGDLKINDFLSYVTLSEGYKFQFFNDGAEVANKDKIISGTKFSVKVLSSDNEEVMEFNIEMGDGTSDKATTTTSGTGSGTDSKGGVSFVWVVLALVLGIVVGAGVTSLLFIFVFKKKENEEITEINDLNSSEE